MVLLTGGSGCSIRKLAYGWAGKLLANRVIATFDLNDAQKRDLLPRVTALHEWHRKNELPRYVTFLDAVIAKAADGFDRQEVEWMLHEAIGMVERLSARFSPEAGSVLSTLSDAQITHADDEFKKGEKERFEKLELSEEDYVKHRLKVARKNFKTWLGSYSDAQLAEYERFIRKNRQAELRRRKRYEDNQEILLKTLHTHPGPQVLSDLVNRWLTRQEVHETPEFQAAEKRDETEFVELVLAIDRLMTQEQRQHLIDELRSWRRDFYELASGI
jgi:hypothetical protein